MELYVNTINKFMIHASQFMVCKFQDIYTLCLTLLHNIDYFYFLGYGNYQTPYQHPRPDQQLPPIPPSYSQHA